MPKRKRFSAEDDERNIKDVDEYSVDNGYVVSLSINDEAGNENRPPFDNGSSNSATTNHNELDNNDCSNDETPRCFGSTQDLIAPSSSASTTLASKKRVSYGPVTIYYFQRTQGFTCVPTSGGSTLGMLSKHYAFRLLTINEHQEEIRLFRQSCLEEKHPPLCHEQQREQYQQPSVPAALFPDSHQQGVMISPSFHSGYYIKITAGGPPRPPASFFEDKICNNNAGWVDSADSLACCEEMDEPEEEEEEEEEEGDEEDDGEYSCGEYEEASEYSYAEDNESGVSDPQQSTSDPLSPTNEYNDATVAQMPDDYYLQPLDAKQRRSLLKESGIQPDKLEKQDCVLIRASRQRCGCACPNGRCLPETCSCAADHIKCQVDRAGFPCSCIEASCSNDNGRVEFNSVRVRSHYLSTMMRLRFSDKLSDEQQNSSPTHTRFDRQLDYQTTYLSPASVEQQLNESESPFYGSQCKKPKIDEVGSGSSPSAKAPDDPIAYSLTTLYTSNQKSSLGVNSDGQLPPLHNKYGQSVITTQYCATNGYHRVTVDSRRDFCATAEQLSLANERSSSPGSELGAVLKKSICESVLA